jgi:hypothetical protein
MGTSAAQACRIPPQPFTREQAQKIDAKGGDLSFRGKVLERYIRCADVEVPGEPTHLLCLYDLKIEVMESFGQELRGLVLLKGQYHRLWRGCGRTPQVGAEEYFIVYKNEKSQLSVQDTGER